ncbi:MAG: hypothetical protein NDJ90_07850, partial [Oligoflexia bacterium]|nr:hypothetical protein [Oligoflexia bacterium]
MSDLFDSLSSLFGKRKRPNEEPSPELRPDDAEHLRTLDSQRLRALNDAELAVFLETQDDRALPKLLGRLTDQDLQLRLVQAISRESALKRIRHSGLDKKIHRAAEKRLRESGASTLSHRLGELSRLSDRLQAFLDNPHWPEARPLVARARSVAMPAAEPADDSAQGILTRFETLRSRLERELAEQETTTRPAAPTPVPPQREAQAQREAPPNRGAQPQREIQPERDARPPKAAEHPEHKRKQEHKRREAQLEALLARLTELEGKTGTRETAGQLRKLQSDAAGLRRWQREFPEKLRELEDRLKTASVKNAELLKEAQWDAWARTDQASRLLSELESYLAAIEAEPEPTAALERSVGLAQRLYDYGKTMRELGSLERGKDQPIWERFKALTERGFVLCDRMRQLVLERLQTTLTEHSTRAPDLKDQKAQFTLRASGFDKAVAAQVSALRSLWSEIGGRKSDESREAEAVVNRLFESYFRQHNLHAGQLQRSETQALQKSRQLLGELKIACEGRSTLHSRLLVAKRLEERWQKTTPPASHASELEAEFEALGASLTSQLAEENEKHLSTAAGLDLRAQALLKDVEEGKAEHLPQVLKRAEAIDTELRAIEQQLGQYRGLAPRAPAASAGTTEERFTEFRTGIRKVLGECRSAVERQLSERVRARSAAILEAEELALSAEPAASRARFEELRSGWKKLGQLG